MGANCERICQSILKKEHPLEFTVSKPESKPVESEARFDLQQLESNTSEFNSSAQIPFTPRVLRNDVLLPVRENVQQQFRGFNTQDFSGESPKIMDFFNKKFGVFDNSKSLDEVPVRELPAMKLLDGTMYKGEWDMKGRRHGRGVEYLPDGGQYIGYFRKNKRDWKGRLVQNKGTFYQGHFSDGQPHGFGFYIHENGAEYQGTFQGGLQHGQGKEKYLDGSVYEGEFVSGKKHGMGTFQWKNGRFYKGQFAHGLMHGHGELVWPNGNHYNGSWDKGNMHGNGVFNWADGKVYVGQYARDKKEGNGKITWPDGKEYDGEWRNGKQHGTGKLTIINQQGHKETKVVRMEAGKVKSY